MNFYCQLDYEHIPYPSPSSPNGNLADNGCGVCCASMIVEAMTGQSFPPEEGAILAKACGAREGFGTSMVIYGPVFAEKFGMRCIITEDSKEALKFLQDKRGMVIANTKGDREDWIGVFSDARHFVVVAAAEGNEVAVWDPMYRPGRYDVPGRAGKVRMDGTTAYADFSVIENDCITRAYYLFEKLL
jgi:hypothetical protein